MESLVFSATDIELYLRCPRQYYFSKIMDVPGEEKEVLSFGTVMHSAMEMLNRGRMEGKILPFSLLEAYVQDQLKEDWYRCRMEYRQRLEEGVKLLKRLYEYEISRKNLQVISTEEYFEQDYIDVMNRKHKMIGRMDVIYRKENGTVEIVDYKSGYLPPFYGAKSINAKSHISKKPQSIIYYMAYTQQRIDERVWISYYFMRRKGDKPGWIDETFTEDNIRSFTYTPEVVQEAKAILDTCIEGILNGRYETVESSFGACRSCIYGNVCRLLKSHLEM